MRQKEEIHEKEPEPKTAWLFPGQGTQFVGMGKSLYEKDPSVREIYEQADKILGYPLSLISFEGPADLLSQTRHTQPATFIYSYINMWAAQEDAHNDFCRQPVFVAGHSFGEYNALVAAGALSFADGLRVVAIRADLTQQASEITPGGMMVVRSNEEGEVLREALEKYGLDLCVINADDQVVIGGPKEALHEAGLFLKDKGLKTTLLNISGAFHTRLMAPAAEKLEKILETVEIRNAHIPIIANTTARPIRTPQEIRKELIEQLTKPVYWRQTIEYLKEQGITKTLEVGEKGVLTNINKKVLGGAAVLALAGLAAAVVWRHQNPEKGLK